MILPCKDLSLLNMITEYREKHPGDRRLVILATQLRELIEYYRFYPCYDTEAPKGKKLSDYLEDLAKRALS